MIYLHTIAPLGFWMLKSRTYPVFFSWSRLNMLWSLQNYDFGIFPYIDLVDLSVSAGLPSSSGIHVWAKRKHSQKPGQNLPALFPKIKQTKKPTAPVKVNGHGSLSKLYCNSACVFFFLSEWQDLDGSLYWMLLGWCHCEVVLRWLSDPFIEPEQIHCQPYIVWSAPWWFNIRSLMCFVQDWEHPLFTSPCLQVTLQPYLGRSLRPTSLPGTRRLDNWSSFPPNTFHITVGCLCSSVW